MAFLPLFLARGSGSDRSTGTEHFSRRRLARHGSLSREEVSNKIPGVFLVMAVGLVAAPQPLLGQQVGDRVRATTTAGMVVGEITAVSGNGFELALDGAREDISFSVAYAEIISLEKSRRSRTPWIAGALGGAFGGLVGLAASSRCSDQGLIGCKQGAVYYENTARNLFAGVGIGGALGFAVGSLLSGDRWVPIQIGVTESALSPVVRLDFHGPAAAFVGLRLRP